MTAKRILIVEDTEDNRQIMRDLLTAAGYDVVEAHDGLMAARTAAELKPELIVMDIQLPILNGYEAARLMRADPALRNVPIIAVTSYALSGDEEKARSVGCNGYIAKPFSPRQLLASIRGFLD
jgi:two-component system cell cycle response regulator DivK